MKCRERREGFCDGGAFGYILTSNIAYCFFFVIEYFISITKKSQKSQVISIVLFELSRTPLVKVSSPALKILYTLAQLLIAVPNPISIWTTDLFLGSRM